jgi:ankyrin repeat protein
MEKQMRRECCSRKAANVNAKDAFGWTALHWAAVNGRLVVARPLLENGAQAGRENKGGWTALHFSVSQGHEAVTRLSLGGGADPWSVDVENM